MIRLTFLLQLKEWSHLLLENKWLKLLSIVLAVLLFIFSRQPTADVRLNGVPVEFHGVPPGMEIVTDDSPMVTVRLQGPRNVVTSLTSNQIWVTANLTNKEPGARIAHLQPNNVRRPDHVEVLQISPPNLRLHLERTASRSVRVDAKMDNRLMPGLEIYDIQIIPPFIDIEGPESEVNKVERLNTETVNLAGRSGPFETFVDVETSERIRVKTQDSIKLHIEIGEMRERRLITGINVTNDSPRGVMTLSGRPVALGQTSIEIFGPRSLVRSLSAAEVRATVNLSGSPRSGQQSLPAIALPDQYRSQIRIQKVMPVKSYRKGR